MAISKPEIGSTGWGDEVWAVIDRINELEDIDATSDADKPVSTAQQAALDLKADDADLTSHTGNTSNPHSVTKTQVGLGSVDNVSATSLRDRSTHSGTQSADTIVDGSTNKVFTQTDETKLAGIATGATANSSDATLLNRTNHTGSQAQSTVTNLTTDLAAKAPIASPTFTGTVTAPLVISTPVNLTDGATPALNAALGEYFRLAALGDRTIAIPSNPTDGQVITIEHLASGGARTLALNTGTGGFAFGTTITALTQTVSGDRDFIRCIYNSSLNKWLVVGYSKGF